MGLTSSPARTSLGTVLGCLCLPVRLAGSVELFLSEYYRFFRPFIWKYLHLLTAGKAYGWVFGGQRCVSVEGLMASQDYSHIIRDFTQCHVNLHSCTENIETRSNLTCPCPVLVVKITTTQQVHTVPAVAQWMCHTNPFRSTWYAAICSNILGSLGNTGFRCFCEISHSRDSKLTFPTSQEMGCPSNESHRTTDSLGWKEAPQVLYSCPA